MPLFARAATLGFAPASGNVQAGNIFTVRLVVDTQGVAINSVDATLNFPTDLLQVMSISKSNSIFSLWVQDPTFSNTDGTISLTGGLPNPGFDGSAGDVVNVVFRAQKAGSASIVVSSGDVLANDGEGTDVLTTSGTGQFTLTAAPPSPPIVNAPSAKTTTQFVVNQAATADPTLPTVTFDFNVKNDASRIDHYVVQVDNGVPQTYIDNGSHQYTAPAVAPGDHVLVVQAIDTAGNSYTSSVNFSVAALVSPTVTDYPKQLQSGDPLVIRGSTYPNSTVTVWLQKGGEDPTSSTVESDANGQFTFTANEAVRNGIYNFWTQVTEPNGASSLPSDKIAIAVAPSAITRVGMSAIDILTIVVPLAALILALIFVLTYGGHKLRLLRKRVKKESRDAEFVLHKAVDLLRGDMQDHLTMLEKTRGKRALTVEEEKISKQLKKDIDLTEKIVRDALENIENEVR